MKNFFPHESTLQGKFRAEILGKNRRGRRSSIPSASSLRTFGMVRASRVSRDILESCSSLGHNTQLLQKAPRTGHLHATELRPLTYVTGPGKGPLSAHNEHLQNPGFVLFILQDVKARANSTSRSGTCCLNLHITRQDAIFECKQTSYNNSSAIALTKHNAERIRHILQIAIPLPYRIPHSILRSSVDGSNEIAMEYHPQDRLHLRAVLHHLFDVERLQAYA